MSTPTDAVLQSHLQAARDGVDAVMQDYTDESVLITHDATYRGLAEIRQFFTTLLNGLPEGFFDAFKMNRQEVVGEVAYIFWEAKPWLPLATGYVRGPERKDSVSDICGVYGFGMTDGITSRAGAAGCWRSSLPRASAVRYSKNAAQQGTPAGGYSAALHSRR